MSDHGNLTSFHVTSGGDLLVCGLSIQDALARRTEAAGKPLPSAPPWKGLSQVLNRTLPRNSETNSSGVKKERWNYANQFNDLRR